MLSIFVIDVLSDFVKSVIWNILDDIFLLTIQSVLSITHFRVFFKKT